MWQSPCLGVGSRSQATPGVLNPPVTQKTIGATVCVKGWTTTIRTPESYASGFRQLLGRAGGIVVASSVAFAMPI